VLERSLLVLLLETVIVELQEDLVHVLESRVREMLPI
jgi:hypothetical protein